MHGLDIPWLPYSLTFFLSQVIPTHARVLEFGGGASTSWWLSRGNIVTTLEPSDEYFEGLKPLLKKYPDRFELLRVTNEFELLQFAEQCENLYYAIVNDGLADRNLNTRIAVDILDTKGILILDNSERMDYSPSLTFLDKSGFRRLDFFDLSPINAFCSQASIFSRTAIQLGEYPLKMGKRIVY
jgi:hypothetical protein